LLALAAAGPAGAQGGGVEVVAQTPGRAQLGGQTYVVVRGLLANRGPVTAADIEVTLRLRRSPGGEQLAPPGIGLSWLDPLLPGETSPFAVLVRYCCPDDVGAHDLSLGWRGGATAPYRGLRASAQALRETPAGPRLFGSAVNGGEGFVEASTVRVYAGFWSGADLVDARAVLVPAVFDDGPGGMALGPGQSLPWSTTIPTGAYDRVELWARSEPYPAGVFPVPLGVTETAVRPAPDGVTVVGRVRNCGLEAAPDLYALLVARDATGAPLQFLGQPLTGVDLAPGAARAVALSWPGAVAASRPATVTLEAFALAQQLERPAAYPCRELARRFLPLAWPGAAPGR
jgi:hypothetical protein